MKSPNRYVNNYNFGPTQKLYEDLIIEAIRFHGMWFHYLPRTSLNMDDLFGESTANTFEDAVKIEGYWNDPGEYSGSRAIQQFGPEFHDEVKITIAQKRFEEVRAEHLIAETGENMEQEITNRYHAGQVNGILLEEGNIEGYFIPYSQPREGDLLWVPLMQKMFVINFVQHDGIFWQGGKLPTYDLYCQLFEYSHDEMNTGDSDIDSIEDLFNGNVMNNNITDTDGEDITQEDGGTITQESSLPENTDSQAENDFFRINADDVVDFSEKSPFVKRNEDMKW